MGNRIIHNCKWNVDRLNYLWLYDSNNVELKKEEKKDVNR